MIQHQCFQSFVNMFWAIFKQNGPKYFIYCVNISVSQHIPCTRQYMPSDEARMMYLSTPCGYTLACPYQILYMKPYPSRLMLRTAYIDIRISGGTHHFDI